MPAGLDYVDMPDFSCMSEGDRALNEQLFREGRHPFHHRAGPRLTQREAETLVRDLVAAYNATLNGELAGSMSASEEARFIHDWAEKFVKAEP